MSQLEELPSDDSTADLKEGKRNWQVFPPLCVKSAGNDVIVEMC